MKKTYKILLSFFLILMSGLGFSQSVPTYVPTNGLVGWWGFNGNAQDGSGNGNHGTVNGATLTTDRFGNQNGAYSFDGVDDKLTYNNTFIFHGSGERTISFWFNCSNTRAPYSTLFFSRLTLGETDRFNFYLYPPNGGSNVFDLRVDYRESNITQHVLNNTTNNFLNTNNWYNVVITRSSNTYKLYINGNFYNEIQDNSPNLPNGPGWQIGIQPNYPYYYSGKVDEIGTWNRALTPQEITNLYNSQVSQPCTTSVTTNHNINGCGFAILANGDTVTQSGNYLDTLSTSGGCDSILNQTVTIQPTSFCNPVPTYVPTNGLVGWWGFNGNAQDGSGNGNHGTVNGATLTTDRFGNQFSSYDFDGNDWINVAQDFSSGNNPKSFSVWFKLDESTYNWILSGGVSSNSHAFGLYTENQRIWFHGDGHTTFDYNFSNITINSWHHVAITYGLGVIKAYLNGIYIGQHSIVLNTISNHISFGRRNNGTAYLNGKLDDIGIWNRALTPQEITNLYNSQLPTQTSLCLPTITTSSPSSVGVDTVVIGGDISNDGGSSIVLRGVCYSTSPNPNMGNQRTEDGSGTGSFNTVLRGLSSSTTYYARSYAKNSNGVVVYGNEVSFTTSASIPGVRCPGTPSVTDIDGNIYNTVQIGNQCWTQSNLRTSRYRNGDSLTYYPSSGTSTISQWGSTTNGIFTNSWNPQYGHLYNGYGAIDSRGLCPTGWVIGNDSDWNILIQSLDSNFIPNASIQSNIAGSKIKSVNGWNSPNIATNESGFSAFPAHYRYISGSYHGVNGSQSGFWTSSIGNHPTLRYIRSIGNDNGNVNREGLNLGFGFSVRCLQKQLPVVITDSVNQIKSTSAQINGRITNDWGDIYTLRGFCYSNTPNPTINNDTVSNGRGLGTYSATINGLSPFTTYYVRSFARNDLGISYGSEVSFRTSQLAVGDFYGGGYIVNIDTLTRTGLVCAPTDTGWHVWGCMGTNIIGTSSTLGSGQNNTNLILAGCSARPIAASVCADLVLNGYDDWFLPSSQELLLAYTRLRPMNIGNLGPMNYTSTQINSDLVNDVNTSGGFIGIIGQAFKWQNSGVRPFRYFTLPSLLQCGSSTVTDIDGNVYNTVLIGNQCWTQSNLKTSKYRNGDNILTGLSDAQWGSTSSGAYVMYNNDPANDGLYGKLYNWYAVTDNRGLCPTGWHVPTDSEWNVLVKYLDSNADTACAHCWQSSIAGGSMKSTATQPTPGGWNAPNTGATNSSGFTGLPGGSRASAGGGFANLGDVGLWWSSSYALPGLAWYRNVYYYFANANRHYGNHRDGFSVRCLKD